MIRVINLTRAGLILSLLGLSQPAAGQTTPTTAPSRAGSAALAPAPPPIAPATISRTAEGAVTVRAVRIPEAPRIDGRLDEAYYRDIPAMGAFIQQDPVEGAPETEKTEVWILFDDDNIYVSVRCWDSHPEREIANELRRDANGILQNDSFSVSFDTFHDRRNSVFFQTTPIGAVRDVAITDEGTVNIDWNAVWDVKTQRSDQGWIAEFEIPFKSLRYSAEPVQIWGVNFRRVIRWKNEWTYLTNIPAYAAQRGIFLMSLAATMVGLETPPTVLNLELKPYGISGIRTDRKATPAFNNKVDRNFGFDAKYGLSKSLTLDLTYNTDFAQVEDDTQQVNLTRFNQFFPERREFFLEGSGIFAFGPGGGGPGGGGGVNNTPVVFFSRRIGLNNNRPVPIAGGGRLTGRSGPYSIGVLNIQSEKDEPSNSRTTNFTVVRLKRNVLRRSNIGVLYTRRDETARGGASTGQTAGVDALYSYSTALNINGYYARTEKPGVSSGNTSYLTRFDYNADRYGFQAERLKVGETFNPEVGFLRRTDFVRNFLQARFSPRPARNTMKAIRRFIYMGNVEYIENNHGRLDFREQEGQFQIELFNSDRLSFNYTRDYELLPKAFAIATDVTVPEGGYTYQNFQTSYAIGTQHAVSGNVSFQQGSLYGGTKRTLGLGGGRTEITSQFALEPSFSLNWVDLPWGNFTTSVITERTTYTISPRSFVSVLTQYASSSHTLSTNARFRWEYRPGSEMFVVYSDGRDTVPSGFPPIVNRAFIVKINRLFRF